MKNLRDTVKMVGEECRKNRIAAGIRLEELAYELGYTKENLNAFERGKNNSLYIYMFYKEKGLIS